MLVLVQLTVVIEPLYSGLEAAGLVDGAGHHGLAAHDVLAHGELGQVVGGGARLQRDVSGVRAVRASLEPGESCSLYHRVGEVVQHGLLAGRHPLVQQLQHRVRPQRGHHLGVDTVRASYRAGQRKLELARAG